MRAYIGDVSVIVGGTPCQSFSIAGLREGLSDERGNLALEFMRLVGELRPQWVVWENVPGVLSSGRGRDFSAILGALAQLGYGFAYRVLDAQYFGVPQRRKRVFLVGHIGGRAERAAAVLFEPAGVRGNPEESKRQGQEAARAAGEGARSRGWHSDGVTFAPQTCGTLSDGAHMGGGSTDRTPTLGVCCPSIANTLTRRMHKGINTTVDEGQTPIITTGGGFDESSTSAVAFAQNSRSEIRLIGRDGSVTGALSAKPGAQQQTFVAFHRKQEPISGAVSPCLSKSSEGMGLLSSVGVRRLTPTECERLQGFPDGWTLVPWRGKQSADGPRYQALGNSMAVPVMRWIGERIAEVDSRVPRR